MTADRHRRQTRLLFLASVATVLAIFPSGAVGQGFSGVEINGFHPATSQRMNYLTVESGESLPGGGWEAGLMFQYANDPFVANRGDERLFSVVEHQVMMDLLAAYSPIDNLQFSIDLPFYLYQAGDADIIPQVDEINSGGIGDLRMGIKWTFFHGRSPGQGGLDAAILAIVTAPTGKEDALQGGDWRGEPKLAADYVTASGFGLGLNVGFLIRGSQEISNVEVENQFTYGLGMKVPLVQRVLTLLVEFYGGVTVGADDAGSEESPAEVLAALRTQLGNFYLTFGGGTGVIEGVGSPDYRLFLGLAYSMGEEDADRDGDGYRDDEDGCPDDPEDFDGFEDEDGCPDPDNDNDGILDVDDDCPDDAEDIDGWEDEDGCPDPDNDADGYLDGDDGCPNDPEDFDEFEDEDGCPDPDNDADFVLDVNDGCPMVPEDLDGFEDEDGCPEEGPAIMRPTIIEITDQIQFEYDSDVILSRSYPVLDAVAGLMTDHPEITLLGIEGHTSTEGDAGHNMDLSVIRATAVLEALVERGIARDRMTSEGFGETRPLEPDETVPGALELNRRVEFQILERTSPEEAQ